MNESSAVSQNPSQLGAGLVGFDNRGFEHLDPSLIKKPGLIRLTSQKSGLCLYGGISYDV